MFARGCRVRNFFFGTRREGDRQLNLLVFCPRRLAALSNLLRKWRPVVIGPDAVLSRPALGRDGRGPALSSRAPARHLSKRDDLSRYRHRWPLPSRCPPSGGRGVGFELREDPEHVQKALSGGGRVDPARRETRAKRATPLRATPGTPILQIVTALPDKRRQERLAIFRVNPVFDRHQHRSPIMLDLGSNSWSRPVHRGREVEPRSGLQLPAPSQGDGHESAKRRDDMRRGQASHSGNLPPDRTAQAKTAEDSGDKDRESAARGCEAGCRRAVEPTPSAGAAASTRNRLENEADLRVRWRRWRRR
jgi:hypothetical protein